MTKDFLLRLTEEHYGAGAFPVYGRLLEEQRLTRGGPLLPMWYCTAALRRAFGGENVLVLGCTNDSLLAHLLGATPVNPLPPHYHCPNCHHLIFDAHADDGWDLPDLACPECGAPMAADGHNLRSRSLIGESVVSLQVPQEQFAPVCAWLRDYWAQRDCQTDTEPYRAAAGGRTGRVRGARPISHRPARPAAVRCAAAAHGVPAHQGHGIAVGLRCMDGRGAGRCGAGAHGV